MNSPAVGIAYVLWLKARWVIGGMLVYIVGMATAIRLDLFPDAADQIMCSSLLLVFALATLLNALVFSPIDLGAKGSVYPTHMLVLPLRTRALVGWPMLCGGIVNALLWVLLASLVFIPGGFAVSLVWPAAILAAVGAWVQAIAWSPFPSPFARVPMLFLAVCPTVVLGIWAGSRSESQLISAGATVGALLWMLVGYGFGVVGLSRFRTGREWNWFRMLAGLRTIADHALRQHSARDTMPPFHSANAAQMWYERRRNALFMPAILGFFSMFVLALLISTMREWGNNPGVMIGSIQVQPSVIALGLLLFLPILFSTMTSQNIAKFDLWGKTEMTPFFAARPINTTQLVRNKMKTAAICALASWGIVISILLTWAVLDISPVNRQPSLVRGFLDQATTKDLVKVLLAAVLFLFIIWRNLVVGMWPALIGRKWISTAIGLLAAGAVFSAPGLYGWLLRQPDLKETLARELPWILGGIVALKLCAAAAIGTVLRRRSLLTNTALGAAALTWLAMVLLIFGVAGYLTEWTWYLAAGAALLVPLTSLAAAPLALDWNRHR